MLVTKKPITVEAFHFKDEESVAELEDFVNNGSLEFDPIDYKVYINTLEGRMNISYGDYVIKGVKGEFYPCKPDIFKATYTEGEDKWATLKTLVDAIVNEGDEMGYDPESNGNYHRFEAYLAIKNTMDMLEGLEC